MTKEGAVSSHHQVSVKFCIRVRANVTDAIDPNRDTRTEIAVLNIKMQKADGLKARFSFSILVTKTDFAFEKSLFFKKKRISPKESGRITTNQGKWKTWISILVCMMKRRILLLFAQKRKAYGMRKERHAWTICP